MKCPRCGHDNRRGASSAPSVRLLSRCAHTARLSTTPARSFAASAASRLRPRLHRPAPSAAPPRQPLPHPAYRSGCGSGAGILRQRPLPGQEVPGRGRQEEGLPRPRHPARSRRRLRPDQDRGSGRDRPPARPPRGPGHGPARRPSPHRHRLRSGRGETASPTWSPSSWAAAMSST